MHQNGKVKSLEELTEVLTAERRGKKVVLCHGVFDLLHIGHIRHFEQARALGDILVVTGGKNSGDFLRLLANGKEFGLKHIGYTYQEGEGGIADALALAEHFQSTAS